MFTSFSTSLSALTADSTAIDVVGNNLANLNTVGFKADEVSFHDLVTQSIGAGLGDTQVGFGVGSPTTETQFAQGALQTTSAPLDAAIQGEGFFLVSPQNGGTEFTRAGSFKTDASGNLITATGEHVQGWTSAAGVLNTNAPPSDIQIPVGTLSAPVPSTKFSFDMNLNASAAVNDTYSTSVQVYDSLGDAHVVTATFTNTAAGQWSYSVAVPNSDVTSSFTPVTGTLTFDSNGNLTSPASTDTQPQIPITGLADGASDMNLTWNLYNGTTPDITQFSQTSAVSAVSQNGIPPSQLSQVGIGANGQVLAEYANGQQQVVGQLAMAVIPNPESLVAVGDNNYQATGNTGLPAIGVPGTGGRGTVVGGSLEASNVDIATEFTNLIVFQRAYQANAKVVTTVDQLSQDTISLKT